MRWSIIRVVWLRELRDQLRDRRTVFMIVVLPILIYPLAGLGMLQLAVGFQPGPSQVGVVGAEHLSAAGSPGDVAILLAATPQSGPVGAAAPLGRHLLGRLPPLLDPDNGKSFAPGLFSSSAETSGLLVRQVPGSGARVPTAEDAAREQVDLLLVVPADFVARLERGERPALLLAWSGDRGKLAQQRLLGVLERWRDQIKAVRFARLGLPADHDQPFTLRDPTSGRPGRPGTENLFDLLIRVFPFVIVLWSLAGALYPAVDLCAGEKERGTMETLLISPAQREEIVLGKFLAIWVFSGVTALLNMASMAVTAWQFSSQLGGLRLAWMGLLWCVVLLLPLSAFFSALCLAIGAYARSSKEGQYYLMPLFLATMPLVFITLVPGVELNPFYSMVPVTGVALLLQKLLLVAQPDRQLWLYFIPVLIPTVVYSWLALRWAIDQFKREEVLFREAERLEIRLWLRRLLRDKEARPSAGQALFCFAVLFGLMWFSLGLGRQLLVANAIRILAFLFTPPLMMALMLTTQPVQSLALRRPPLWSWPMALVLALVLYPPLAELTLFILQQNRDLERLVQQYRPFTDYFANLKQDGPEAHWLRWQALLVFGWLPAIGHELAFRGFILTGLQRRYRPRTAVLLTSFLFALFHMNVFQFVPMFLLGMVLAYLTTRCGSILPSMLFHVTFNTLLLAPSLFPGAQQTLVDLFGLSVWSRILIGGTSGTVAAGLLAWLTTKYPHPAYVAFLSSDPGLDPSERRPVMPTSFPAP